MNETLFKKDLATATKDVIKKLKKDGTVAMGADNLWQLVVSRVNKQHGPVGTNAAYMARVSFNEVIAQKPFYNFLLTSN